ncbi:uncharacterized protein LOC111862152 [Cryptotermes secundus]|uniref:uncharacterized protein LOC111862152 n=1 Tax=Cryptotermes secundus TaxID=105785 RepID=UPI000CD7BAE2|nr:uncharacterized protein LOC111862152 [Cryptotermes secundus]
MLTRREKLLTLPWQQRRYDHHRHKVQSALPAIDVGPPSTRGHVCCKLKKQQNEQERITQIELNNCRLLQRMGTIMKTNRLDNHWVNPPPSFMQREGIYYFPAQCGYASQQASPPATSPDDLSNMKRRCLACNQQKNESTKPVPKYTAPTAHQRRASHMRRNCNTATQAKTCGMTWKRNQQAGDISPRRITFTRRGLQLAVSFPADTTIRLEDGQLDHLLQREYCGCKAIKLQ